MKFANSLTISVGLYAVLPTVAPLHRRTAEPGNFSDALAQNEALQEHPVPGT